MFTGIPAGVSTSNPKGILMTRKLFAAALFAVACAAMLYVSNDAEAAVHA